MIFRRKEKRGDAGASNFPSSDGIREVASDWLIRRDAGLTPREERELSAWLDQDPRHRAALSGLEEIWTTFDRPLATGAADSVLCELERRAARRGKARVFAAAAAVVVLVGGFGWRTLQPEPELKPTLATTAAVLLPRLQSLPDGSIAELREGADFSVDFSPEQRRIVLRSGQAYFKVAKNPNRPFIVVAGGIEVRAVGTAFSVDLASTEVEVLVTEGKVRVDVPSSDVNSGAVQERPPLMIAAGDGAVVRRVAQGDQPRVDALSQVDLQSRLAWRSPRLEFSGTPLIEAVALMNRHNQVQFVILDPELARVRVSGIFGAVNTDAFVRLLEVSFNVQAERSTSDEIVLRRNP